MRFLVHPRVFMERGMYRYLLDALSDFLDFKGLVLDKRPPFHMRQSTHGRFWPFLMSPKRDSTAWDRVIHVAPITTSYKLSDIRNRDDYIQEKNDADGFCSVIFHH